MRVLFVDDDERVLSGLRRVLRKYRDEWDVQFVTSGEEALALMREHPVDALVSDMRMPGMDGATLLKHAHDSHPDTVRFVLSGLSNAEAIMRGVAVAHQFLAKPCKPEVIKESIEGALRLRELIASPDLLATVGQVETLPACPSTYRRLNNALACSEVDAARIAEVVETDPAVTAKLLQLVNSPFFGLQRDIRDVRSAVVYLGQDTVRDLVLGVGLFQAAEKVRRPALAQAMARLGRHSACVGVLARELADGKPFAPYAFTAGVVHDIGALVWATQRPVEYARALELSTASDIAVAEREVLGADHAAVGAYLLGLWGLPYPILEAVAFHHKPQSSSTKRACDLALVLHVSDALIAEASPDFIKEPELDEAYLEELGVLTRLPEWREQAAKVVEGCDV